MITLTAKITLSNGNGEILIDRKNIISLESAIYDRSDLQMPSFGIISNEGNIKFNDFDGKILTYAEGNLLSKGLNCTIYLNNTLTGTSTIIGVFETDEWEYDSDNFIVNVRIKDDLEEWQDINVEGIQYDFDNTKTRTCKDYYEYLYEITNKNYKMQSFMGLDDSTKNQLAITKVKYFILEEGSLWEQWTKLCQVCNLHIFKDRNGLINCKYNGGN